jgi:hypothetical protein
MRELAELARASARTWDSWAAKAGRRDEMAYGARSLSHLFQAMAFVMDGMADRELLEDGVPPVAALIKGQIISGAPQTDRPRERRPLNAAGASGAVSAE